SGNGAAHAVANGKGTAPPVAHVRPTLAVPTAVPSNDAALDEIPPFEGSDAARATLDALLRAIVEKGASDLHLRVGEPPIVRQHGEMTRLTQHPPLTHDQLSAMMRSIMPERNRLQYAETSDADYAYELPGCARFRANAARDRNGAVA